MTMSLTDSQDRGDGLDPVSAYIWCPRCRTRLVRTEQNLLACSSCGFHFYINPIPCNAAVVENNEGAVLLVKRKFPPQEGLWDLPGGFMQPGEELNASVERELMEELNVRVRVGGILGMYPDTYIYQGIRQKTISIVVTAGIEKGTPRPADDISGFAFFKKDEIPMNEIAFSSMKQGLADYFSRRRQKGNRGLEL